MTQSTGMPGGSDDNPLANGYYVNGYNSGSDSSYDPNLINKAIKEEIEHQLAEITAGGHVSMGETMMLMYLMQGFGGEVVGLDGQAANSLQQVQGYLSKAWQIADQVSNGSYPKDKNATQGFLNQLNSALGVLNDPAITKNIPPDELKQIKDSISGVMNFLVGVSKKTGSQDPLRKIYQEANPKNPQKSGDPKTQGNPADLDSFTRLMTTANQQITGGSQVMSTQAKMDSKTQQSESTAYNNYMQMIKKMLSYFTQLQRTP